MNRRTLSRRETLKWMGVMSATSAVHMTFTTTASAAQTTGSEFAPWPQLTLQPVTAMGYGQDPNLIVRASGPWPRMLTQRQLSLLDVLSDIIVPRQGDAPSASEVGVSEVLDEWISAPYPRQQTHRTVLEPGLLWMDDESHRRYRKTFVELSESQQFAIVDDIAFAEQPTPQGLEAPKEFFSGLRLLVVGAFFTSPAGIKDLGYIGNTPISGDYPGPTAEALAHLKALMEGLKLAR